MSTPLPDHPEYTGYVVAPPAALARADDAITPPPGYVLVAQADFDRMMDLIAQLQNEREADRIDHADYERLLEKERAEQMDPLPMFLTAPRLTEPTHCIPRLGEFPC